MNLLNTLIMPFKLQIEIFGIALGCVLISLELGLAFIAFYLGSKGGEK